MFIFFMKGGVNLLLSRQDLEVIILYKEGSLKGYSKFNLKELNLYVMSRYNSLYNKILNSKNGLTIKFNNNDED